METTLSKRGKVEPTFLIQRLLKPLPNDKKINGLAFGGGLRNGGLTDKALAMIDSIFRFDYMGAAEFELGAVPKALSKIYICKSECQALQISGKPDSWYMTIPEKFYRREYLRTVWLISPIGDITKHARKVINYLAEQRLHSFKELPLFSHAAFGIDAENSQVQGWLELDNGFLFTIDREMAERLCKLFSIPFPISEINAPDYSEIISETRKNQ